MPSDVPLVIGVVTFNNLELLKQCLPSWQNIPGTFLFVWDNGSDSEVVEWLREQRIDKLVEMKTNRGLSFARNRIIEFNRDFIHHPYILLMDSDVLLMPGSVAEMVAAMDAHPDAGILGYAQANKGFPVSPDGVVEEIANECQLSRMQMWLEIGLFPETVTYYSADSWKSTIANMSGWRTRVLFGEGYRHYKHGSHVNPEVPEAMHRDRAYWLQMEKRFKTYWTRRLVMQKGGSFSGFHVGRGDSDLLVTGQLLDLNDHLYPVLRPSVQRQFTNWSDVQALIHLMGTVEGNYLEVGCNEGLTLMQLAYNFPERQHYGVDFCRPRTREQDNEQPPRERLGWHTRSFRNVRVFDCDFANFDTDLLDDIGLVFIDADHGYDSVKTATEKLLAAFLRHPRKTRRIIAWHDYIPCSASSKDTPAWVQVGHYVRAEVAARFPCRFIYETNLAYMTYVP